jgi:hypothetical protein
MNGMSETSFRLSSDNRCTLPVNVVVSDHFADQGYDEFMLDPEFSVNSSNSSITTSQQPVPTYYPILNKGI